MLPVATELRQKAIRLQREAQGHKAASRWHRDRAREKKQQLDALIAACAERDIQITINNAQPDQGGHGGNQDQKQAAVQDNGRGAARGERAGPGTGRGGC